MRGNGYENRQRDQEPPHASHPTPPCHEALPRPSYVNDGDSPDKATAELWMLRTCGSVAGWQNAFPRRTTYRCRLPFDRQPCSLHHAM